MSNEDLSAFDAVDAANPDTVSGTANADAFDALDAEYASIDAELDAPPIPEAEPEKVYERNESVMENKMLMDGLCAVSYIGVGYVFSKVNISPPDKVQTLLIAKAAGEYLSYYPRAAKMLGTDNPKNTALWNIIGEIAKAAKDNFEKENGPIFDAFSNMAAPQDVTPEQTPAQSEATAQESNVEPISAFTEQPYLGPMAAMGGMANGVQ